MATTRGRVHRLIWAGTTVCASVGPAANNLTLLAIEFAAGDSALALESKRLLVKALATALHTGLAVACMHGDNDSIITQVSFEPLDFSLVGPAIRSDFFAVAGSNFPPNADIVFQVGPLQITVAPDLRRPHWLLIRQLPTAVPTGRCNVFLRSGAWQSPPIPATVWDRRPERRRVLYSGRPVTGAYTFVFAASPARRDGTDNVSDGILSDRPAFHQLVGHSIQNLLTLDESILRTDNLDRLLRFVAIFDDTRQADANTALVASRDPNLINPLPDAAAAYVGAYWERPDIIYAVTDSATFTRASAQAIVDGTPANAAPYTYDGTNLGHSLRPRRPGVIAQSTNMDMTGLTAIHEWGHAASEANAWVWDLYVDGGSGMFDINKKWRALATDAVPANFATVDTTTYAADANRDSLGYPADWRSYHPALRVANRPNLMDNYWQAAAGGVLQCRFDPLTFDWLLRRTRAKANRPE
jgi:hypothetical protein